MAYSSGGWPIRRIVPLLVLPVLGCVADDAPVGADRLAVFEETPTVEGIALTSHTDLAWGDVDGDGDLDVAVGRDGLADVVVLNDNGTLQTAIAWASPVLGNTQAVAWGDVDGDGDLDLATAGDNATYVWENDGGALSTNNPPLFTSTYTGLTTDIAWFDVDDDGDLDLYEARGGTVADVVLSNSGSNLTNTAAWTAPVARDSRGVDVGDVDGDGTVDVAVAHWAGPDAIYFNSASGLPASDPCANANASTCTITHETTLDVALGDMDGDGDLDMASVGHNRFLRIHAMGLSTLTALQGIGSNTDCGDVEWVDRDGDGDLDVVMGCYGSNGSTSDTLWQQDPGFENVGGALAQYADWFSEGDYPTAAIAPGDRSGDGVPDLGVAGTFSQLRIHEGGDWGLEPAAGFGSSVAYQARLDDIDADGNVDVTLAHNTGVTVLLGDGTGTFTTSAGLSIGNLTSVRGVAWADMDDDGDLDLAVAQYTDENKVYSNQAGSLSLFSGSPGLNYSKSPVWADWDGDGDLDLYISGDSGAVEARITNNGLPSASPIAVTSTTGDHTSLAFGDPDGDGVLELAVGRPTQIDLLERISNSSYMATTIAAVNADAEGMDFADWNGDGYDDLVVAYYNSAVRIYNGGPSGITQAWVSPTSSTATDVEWGDWNNDGLLDFAVANQYQPLAVYEQRDGTFELAWQSDLSSAWSTRCVGRHRPRRRPGPARRRSGPQRPVAAIHEPPARPDRPARQPHADPPG